jgi:hypothetical protein
MVGVAACGSPSKPTDTLTAPHGVTPSQGAVVAFASQPVTLTVQNATSTGKNPVTYTFDVATDSGFGNIVFTQGSVPAGTGGQTSITVDKLPANQVYYWRARIADGSANGPVANTASFTVGPDIVINAPQLLTPGDGDTVNDTKPTFTVTDATHTGPVGTIYYRFDVSTSSSFSSVVASGTVKETSTQTSYTVTADLTVGTTYYWRVTATDPANSVTSAASSTESFKLEAGIDLTKVVYVLGPNISTWAQTSTITNAYADGSQLCIYHTKLGIWPATNYVYDTSGGTTVEGNQWVFANINGTWYGGAADWYRPGQACKGVDANSIGQQAFYQPSQEPLHSWIPHSGEIFGVASTTPARAWPSMSTLDQRTNVALIRWP